MQTTPMFIFLCPIAQAQNDPNVRPQNEEKQLVELPSGIPGGDEEMIRQIERKDSLNYADYIQLAISYAHLNAKEEKIEKLILQSFESHTYHACNFWTFMLKHEQKWKMTASYSALIKHHMQKYECE